MEVTELMDLTKVTELVTKMLYLPPLLVVCVSGSRLTEVPEEADALAQMP